MPAHKSHFSTPGLGLTLGASEFDRYSARAPGALGPRSAEPDRKVTKKCKGDLRSVSLSMITGANRIYASLSWAHR